MPRLTEEEKESLRLLRSICIAATACVVVIMIGLYLLR